MVNISRGRPLQDVDGNGDLSNPETLHHAGVDRRLRRQYHPAAYRDLLVALLDEAQGPEIHRRRDGPEALLEAVGHVRTLAGSRGKSQVRVHVAGRAPPALRVSG